MSPLSLLLLISLLPSPASNGLLPVESVTMDLSGALGLSLEFSTMDSRSRSGLSALPLTHVMEHRDREESREETHWSQWSWAIGQYLTRDMYSESMADPWLNRDDLTEILLHKMPMIQIQKLPLDASFHPLGTDPLLHAPAWWNPRGSGDSASTVSLWACDRSADLRSEQGQPIRAGLGLTLDLSSGPEWDCRITGNVDQSGEAGILLQFCWH
ncbi:MAG: hypothetical protein ACPHP7_03855 [Planctomycetota bacterium]